MRFAESEIKKVLIADDDPIIRLDLKQMLENLGYSVVAEAGDGSEALARTQGLRPDICVIDVKMPALDGIEVAKAISEQQIAPVVLLTAYGDRELVERAKNAGVFGYLVKPFKSSDIVPAIEVARSRFEQHLSKHIEAQALQEKLETRKLIDRAKGFLMDRDGLSENQAYRQIQLEAMETRQSMRQVVEQILECSKIAKEA